MISMKCSFEDQVESLGNNINNVCDFVIVYIYTNMRKSV